VSDYQEEVDKNYRAFKNMLPSIMDKSGKYALLRDGQLIAIYDTFDDALQTAHTFYEDEKFSIQHITTRPIDLGFGSRARHRG
jgi:hypothetical protein